MEFLLDGVQIGISVLNQFIQKRGCLHTGLAVDIAIRFAAVLTDKIRAVGDPELLQHIRKTFPFIHNDVGAHHTVFCKLPGYIRKLGPGPGILQLIRCLNPCLVKHIPVVIEGYGTFCCADGVDFPIVSTLIFSGIQKVIPVLFCKHIIQGDNNIIGRVYGNRRSVHIQDIRQVLGGNRRVYLVLISIGIRTNNSFPFQMDFSLVLRIKSIDFFFPPLFNGRFVTGTPDGDHRLSVFIHPFLCISTAGYHSRYHCRCKKYGNCPFFHFPLSLLTAVTARLTASL